MALKKEVATLEDVEEKYRALYTEKDGKFVLDEEAGLVPKTDLQEFMTNNRTLHTEKEDLTKKVGDLTKEVEDLRGKVSGAEEDKKKAVGEKETDLEKRLGEMETRLNEKDKELEQQTKNAATSKLKDDLKTAGAAGGVAKAALGDFANLVIGEWGHDDKGAAVRRVNGEIQLSEERAGQPQNMDEFVAEVAKSKPHLFESSEGDGALGSGNTPATFDLNDPTSLQKAAEKEAERLEGVTR